jgi:hypothetical protein
MLGPVTQLLGACASGFKRAGISWTLTGSDLQRDCFSPAPAVSAFRRGYASEDLRITSLSHALFAGSKAPASFMFAACCW